MLDPSVQTRDVSRVLPTRSPSRATTRNYRALAPSIEVASRRPFGAIRVRSPTRCSR